MFDIKLYAAIAVVTAGVAWYLNRRNQSRGALATASVAAGLLWPILAVGLLQLGLFIAVKRLVRARRSAPEVTAVSENAPAVPAQRARTRGPRTAECRADYGVALPRSGALLVK